MIKQLALLFLSLFVDTLSMARDAQDQKNKLKNMTSYFPQTPRTFGKTHFIRGYDHSVEDSKNKFITSSKHNLLEDTKAVTTSENRFIDRNRSVQSFFTTINDLSPIVLAMIEEAQKILYVAAFNITDARIVQGLINAHRRGVDVCVIVDATNKVHPHSKIELLIEEDVPVWCYKPSLNPHYKKGGLSEPCMHHKIMIGDQFVVTGSANFTKAGQKNNIENINIIREKKTVEEYHAEFDRLKKWCVKCSPTIQA
jgi:phosphatidylserine/phosphatidylglycerophosphate/cardiolipin synthase-like enzyme